MLSIFSMGLWARESSWILGRASKNSICLMRFLNRLHFFSFFSFYIPLRLESWLLVPLI